MLSFNRFLEYRSIEPLLEQTAILFAELDIDPIDYIEKFLEDDSYATPGQNFQQGLSRFGSSLLNGLKGAAGGTAQMGAATGQGAQNWWKQKMDPANKILIAQQALSKLAQGKLGSTALQGGQNVNAVIAAINNQLNQMKNQLPDPITGQPRNAATAPAATTNPGPSTSAASSFGAYSPSA